MTTDLDPCDVVDADVVDDRCQQSGMSYCPGDAFPAIWTADPYMADVNDAHYLVYLHPACARELAQDI